MPPDPHSSDAHRANGRFRNPWAPATTQGRVGSFLKWILIDRPRDLRRRDIDPATFAAEHPRATPTFPSPHAAHDDIVITWVGHSTFLIQIGGYNFLTDPVWGERASPVTWLGPRRWVEPGIDFTALPPVDGVLISHDHYDHLDTPTVVRLATRNPGARWFAPLGVRPWLTRRGARDIIERDWWETTEWRTGKQPTLTLTCTPAQHFSGRRLDNRNHTLWCGWTVRAGPRAVYFVGDTGRHPLFAEIGQRLGPFDATLMPIGAYDPQWFMRPVHVTPEDAVAAYGELANGQLGNALGTNRLPAGNTSVPSVPPLMVGMHWGTFKLTDEPMDEPPGRTRRAWDAAGYPPDRLWVPRHGESRRL
jgi:N-acyl-phosphatidylethanolamine-hydrolysing phospholipase D